MRIERIKIRNYKVLQSIEIQKLPSFAVLVGANGVGKSTLFDVFGFLRDCLKDNVRQALAKRGGFREAVSRGHAGETIEIELTLKMALASGQRSVTYTIEIGEHDGSPIVEREVLRYTRQGVGRPYNFLDFARGRGSAITNEATLGPDTEATREEQQLDSPDILAIKGLGQFQRFEAASAFRSVIENWHLSDFHIQAARASQDAGYAEHLSPTGENLPLVTQFLYERHRDRFDAILKIMTERVPGIANVEATQTADGRIVLRFKDGKFRDPFISRYVSDGTIKMFAYLVLLHDPAPHPLLCVEEPENQLYPTLLGELAEEFQAYAARGGQVLVSTHSPDLLNHVPLSSVLILSKRDGFAQISRASDDANLVAFMREGDLPGSLWRQRLFQGADPQ